MGPVIFPEPLLLKFSSMITLSSVLFWLSILVLKPAIVTELTMSLLAPPIP